MKKYSIFIAFTFSSLFSTYTFAACPQGDSYGPSAVGSQLDAAVGKTLALPFSLPLYIESERSEKLIKAGMLNAGDTVRIIKEVSIAHPESSMELRFSYYSVEIINSKLNRKWGLVRPSECE